MAPHEKKYRLALIGCGPRGREHVRAALATGRFELAAAADLDEDRRAELAARHEAQAAYGDYRELFERERGNLDVVHLCTQPTLRRPVIKAALEAGVKAVVVEKPMALDYSEAAALEKACREAGVLLVVNHQKRGMPEWRALREAVVSGKLGEVTMLQAQCYGNLLAQGTHLFDMAWNVLGEPKPLWVFGTCDPRLSLAETHPAPRDALALLEFEGGVRGSFVLGEDVPVFPNSTAVWFYYHISVHGTAGFARAVLNQGFRRWDAEGRLAESFESRWDEKNQGAGQEQLSRDVAQALDDPAFRHPQRGASALVSFGLVEAVCRSARDGQAVSWPIEPGEDALARWSRQKSAKKELPAHV